MKSSIFITDISDHLPCITVITNPDFNLSGYKMVSHRIINDKNMLNFQNRIDKTKYALAFYANNQHETNINSKFNDYIDHILRIYDDCFPLVTKKVHMKSFSKPWITEDVQKLIDKKNKNFCIYIQRRKIIVKQTEKNIRPPNLLWKTAINNRKRKVLSEYS